MTSRAIIPKENLTAYERWELTPLENSDPRIKGQSFTTAQKVEHIHEQAEKLGFNEGYEKAKKQIHIELQQFKQLISNFEQQNKELDQKLADDLLNLALVIAKQMIRQTLKVRPDVILPLIREAINTLPQPNQQNCLMLHPEDANLIREHLNDYLTQSTWKILEDPSIERGGCRITSSGAEIDATLTKRWQRIVTALNQDNSWMDED